MNLKQTYRMLICTLTALILFFAMFAYADDVPEWLYQNHYVDIDDTRYYLEFYPLPYGPGANFNAWMTWQERSIFSPQPPELTMFLGPLVWHGGILRMGGMLDGYNFVRDCDGRLWFFKDGVELTTEDQ